jgi:hypothetical protein
MPGSAHPQPLNAARAFEATLRPLAARGNWARRPDGQRPTQFVEALLTSLKRRCLAPSRGRCAWYGPRQSGHHNRGQCLDFAIAQGPLVSHVIR